MGGNVKRGSNANKAVYIILALLFAAVAILSLFNRGDRALQRALEENREFQIRVNGEYAAVVSLRTLLDLDPQEFSTSLATSIAAPRETALQGVEMRFLLESLEIDISEASYITVTGLDGYYSVLTRDEVESKETIYVCFSMDGEILNTRSEGGYGPFMMVIRGSRFAQRWCKYLEAVDIITTQSGDQ